MKNSSSDISNDVPEATQLGSRRWDVKPHSPEGLSSHCAVLRAGPWGGRIGCKALECYCGLARLLARAVMCFRDCQNVYSLVACSLGILSLPVSLKL